MSSLWNPGPQRSSLYGDRIEGGKVRLAPARLVGLGFRAGWLAGRVLVRAIGTIRRPEDALRHGGAGAADFHVASRKIDRMRGPGALAAAELRRSSIPSTVDWLCRPQGRSGVWIGPAGLGGRGPPRCESRHARSSVCAQGPRSLVPHASGARVRRRVARSTVSGLRVRLEEDPESLRALAFILVADDDEIRSRLFANEVLEEATCDALRFGIPRGR